MQTRSAPQRGQTRSASATGTVRLLRGRSLGKGERPPCPRGGFGGSGGWATVPHVGTAGGAGSVPGADVVVAGSVPGADVVVAASVALAGTACPSSASRRDRCSVLTFWLFLPYSSRSALRSRVASALFSSRIRASSP